MVVTRVYSNSQQVCALGACFLSHVDQFNKLKVDPYWDGRLGRATITQQLSDVFTTQQMAMIEDAFEQESRRSDTVEALFFGNSFEDDKERLKAIMKNIIKNAGVLVP